MALDARLLEILSCPASGQALRVMDASRLAAANRAIREGRMRTADGGSIARPIPAGLVTANEDRIYPIEDGIPVLLAGQALRPVSTPDAASPSS